MRLLHSKHTLWFAIPISHACHMAPFRLISCNISHGSKEEKIYYTLFRIKRLMAWWRKRWCRIAVVVVGAGAVVVVRFCRKVRYTHTRNCIFFFVDFCWWWQWQLHFHFFFMKEHAKTLCISTMLSCWNIQNINSLHFVCYWRVECCWDFDMRQSSILLLSQRHWPWWQWICVLYAAPATFIYFFYFGIYNFAVSSCCSWSRSRYSTVPMSHSKAQSRLVWECVIRSFMREEWILLEK